MDDSNTHFQYSPKKVKNHLLKCVNVLYVQDPVSQEELRYHSSSVGGARPSCYKFTSGRGKSHDILYRWLVGGKNQRSKLTTHYAYFRPFIVSHKTTMDTNTLLLRFDGRSRLLLRSFLSGATGARRGLWVFQRQRRSDPDRCLHTCLETLCQQEICLNSDAQTLTT